MAINTAIERRQDRVYLFLAIALSGALLILFKIFYPYPNVIFDSYYYVRAAALDWSFNAWPIGYSRFLQIFTFFTHSTLALVCFQYLFLESCCMAFFFTWRLFFQPGRFISHALFILLFFNPLLIYCCNYIISDPLFIGLSLLWITQLLWIICRPRPYMVLTHALLLALAFTVRYNALYYPFIASLVFLLCRQRLWFRIAGIGTPLALVAGFILYTSIRVGETTGAERQFSAFGSWKLANNALYAYEHVPLDSSAATPEKFRELDSLVRLYFRHSIRPAGLLTTDFTSGSFFMFYLGSPLVRYMQFHYGGEWPRFLNTKKYWAVAPLYQSYAFFLIRKYPDAFAREFLWPNFLRYYIPPGEIFGSEAPFHLEESYGGPYLRKLFPLTTIETDPSLIELSKKILNIYPYMMALGHFGFLFGLSAFLVFGGYRKIGKPYNVCVVMIAALWCCDLCFSVLSAGVVLRYQIFVIILELAFGLYFVEYVYCGLQKN